jgi:hypothetical protein
VQRPIPEGGDEVNDLPVAVRGQLLSDLAATLATLSKDQPQTWRLGEAIRQLLEADGVAITMGYLSDSHTTVFASDQVARDLEGLQEIAGEGPGYEAARTERMVTARLDGDADQRWPMLAHAVEERHGPVTVHAVPLHADGTLSGVATIYTHEPRPLSQDPARVAFLANAVGAALLVDASEASDDQPQAGDSWSSRSVVHQATGMVMAQVRVTAEDALALLRGHAYALDTDIGDIAARVVRRAINFSSFEVEGD